MDAIDIPIVAPTLALPEALAVMQSHNISGVLVAVQGTPRLARAEDVTNAINQAVDAGNDPRFASLLSALPAPPAPAPAHLLVPLTEVTLPLQQSTATDALESWFRETDTDHAAMSIPTAGRARLVTRSEGMTAAVGGAMTLCTCDGNPVHTLTRTQVKTGCLCSRSHLGQQVKVKCDDGSCP
jgi:hypothetical protein